MHKIRTLKRGNIRSLFLFGISNPARVVEQKIESLLNEKFLEEDFQDCFVVEIKLHENNKLDVFVDSDSGMTFQKCQKLSRYLEKYLDEEQWLGERYTLEVSSPGIGRPLTLKRQYVKNIGRKLEVTLSGSGKITGILKEVTGEKIVLENKERIKEGKKKKMVLQQHEIPYTDIKKTIVKITFNKK